MTDEEKSELQGWLEESGENRRYYRKMQGFFTRAGHGGEVDVLKNFREFERKTFGKRRRLVVGILKYAAVFVVLVGSVVLWRGMNFDSQKTNMQQFAFAPGVEKAILYTGTGEQIVLESQVRRNIVVADSFQVRQDSNVLNYAAMKIEGKLIDVTHMIRVPRGGEFFVTLADGTEVWLNADSELEYPVKFTADKREVRLKGEAYFSVKKDTKKPFMVRSGEYQLKVYGTEFNLNTYKNNEIQAVLVKGSVGFKANRTAGEVRLKPNQLGVANEATGKAEVKEVDVYPYIAWKSQDVVFVNERLESIMEKAARWYDVNVFFQNESLKDLRFFGNMQRYADIQELLFFLENTSDARFSVKDRTVIVSAK